jgi:hypothetical protein
VANGALKSLSHNADAKAAIEAAAKGAGVPVPPLHEHRAKGAAAQTGQAQGSIPVHG